MTLFELLQVVLPVGVSLRFEHEDAADPVRHRIVCKVVDLRARQVHEYAVLASQLKRAGEPFIVHACRSMLARAGVVIPP